MKGNNAKEEIRSILSSDPFVQRMEKACRRRGMMDRINDLYSVLRDAIGASSVCLCDGVVSYFDSKRYRRIEEKELGILLYNVLCDLGVAPTEARKMPDLVLPSVYDKRIRSNDRLIAFNNGIFDLDQLKLFPFSPQYVTTYGVNYSYIPEACSATWNKFLQQVLPDEHKRNVLQEFIGMIYIDRKKASVEKCLIMLGSGANGKSVVYNVIRSMVGPDYVSTFSPGQLVTDLGKYGVIGKRLNCCSEVQATDAITGALKPLISHEAVQGKGLYQDYVTLRCPPIIFILNELPPMPDKSYGFFRRQIIMKFDQTIPPHQQDRMLASRIIRDDLPAVFNWAMEGRRRLEANGYEFTKSSDIDRVVSQARKDNNPVLAYLSSQHYVNSPRYEGHKPLRVGSSDLYGEISKNGDISVREFSREMDRMGFVKKKSGNYYYELYELKTEDHENYE